MNEDTGAFLNWLEGWHASLPEGSLNTVIEQAGGAAQVAVVVVDLLVGFCSEGPLASARVGALGPKAARFLTAARQAGIRHVVLPQDSHPPDSPEIRAFPPHCITGTREADTIPELTSLPFFAEGTVIPKGSLSVGQEPAFAEWQRAHPEIRGWIIVGDCTDLCVYNTAMYLRLQANTRGTDAEVWVPADLVDTYDLPVAAAEKVGALPHPADLLHRVFLYHMALNGIRVVRSLGP
jgi:nicotinamidase-related amidase